MAKKRILVVEDEPLLAKGIEKLLTRFGYDVIGPVDTAEDAIRSAKDGEPDLALMDITLSGSMDGIEAAEKIRSVKDLPIIYLTASSDKSTLERAKVTTPHGYLLKPFSERELFVTVETALYKAELETRLKESEQRYRSLFEHCPIAIFEVDLSETRAYLTGLLESGTADIGAYLDAHPGALIGCIERTHIIGANQAALSLFDVPDPKEFARDLKQFFDPEHHEGIRDYLTSIAQGSPYYWGSAELKTLSGKSVAVEWTGSVLLGHAQPFSRVSVCVQDVTEKRRAQKELEQTRQELEIRVEQRTADLCRALDRLHREMVSREKVDANLRQRVDELAAINRVSQSMNSSLLPAEVLKCAHDELYAALEPDAIVVYLRSGRLLLHEEIDSMHAKVVLDAPDEKLVGQCLCGLAVAERKSQYCQDTRIDSRCTLPECRHAGLQSLVTLPLLVGDHVLGVIALGSLVERDFREHAPFLETVASHLAVALQNAQLHQQVKDAQVQLEQRVAERTVELAASNENLQKEMRERLLAEEALRQSEAKYRAIFDSAAIGINMVDRDARFIEKNAAMCRIFGYSNEELVGISAFDLTHPDDLQASVQAHRALVEGDCSLYRLEKRYVRKDGEFVWADLSASAVRDQSGQYLATVAVITDITDRKRYELSQAQLVEEIKNFAYIVSHDLRSPLVNLSGFSRELTWALETVKPAIELGMSHMPEQDRAKVAAAIEEDIPESLAFIGSSVSHMNNQVNGLLQLARLGRTELYFEPLAMNDLVDHILGTFAYEITQRGVTVSVGALPDISGDRTSIDQIMANLIGNAVKYLEPSRPGRIAISGERLLEATRFEVHDNGRGIRTEDLGRVFDIFQRSGNTDVAGEGLGLSFVRALVRRHGGRVWCKSTPGVGSTFFFTVAHQLEPQRA